MMFSYEIYSLKIAYMAQSEISNLHILAKSLTVLSERSLNENEFLKVDSENTDYRSERLSTI